MKDSRRKFASSLAGIVLPIITGVLIIGIYLTGCDTVQQTNYIGSIKGYVQDDSLKTPLIGVKITSSEFTQVIYTVDSGMFFIKDLSMGTSEHTYPLLLEFSGYQSKIFRANCKVGEVHETGIIYLKRDSLL
ncbi:MAG: hypothetical protein ACOYN6_05345 [Ignavibacteria bacterium]